MTKGGLLEKLKDVPMGAKIFYEEMNFGKTADEAVGDDWVSYDEKENIILVQSVYWEDIGSYD